MSDGSRDVHRRVKIQVRTSPRKTKTTFKLLYCRCWWYRMGRPAGLNKGKAGIKDFVRLSVIKSVLIWPCVGCILRPSALWSATARTSFPGWWWPAPWSRRPGTAGTCCPAPALRHSFPHFIVGLSGAEIFSFYVNMLLSMTKFG